MFKGLLFITCFLPIMAMAEYSFTKKDLVGDWSCAVHDEDIIRKEIIRYYDNGTASEMLEDRYQYPDYRVLEIIAFDYDWQLKGNRLYMNNHHLSDYRYYYQFDGMAMQSDEEVTAQMKAETLKNMKEYHWNYIEFYHKDKHRYYFEDGFSVDCQRLN